MVKVSVGIPVYNGESLIAECLNCLIDQTFLDLEILIFDNASNDRTGEIALAYAAHDRRIRYFRQTENVGATQNFVDVLAAAQGRYFLWRAYDDLSELDFIEKLYAGITSYPGATLAAGTVESIASHGQVRVYRPSVVKDATGIRQIYHLLFNSHASWFYGLWEADALRQTFSRVWAAYPFGWASDHLTLYPHLINGAVAIVPEAKFIQRIITKEPKQGRRQRKELSHWLDLRRRFWTECRAFVAEADFTGMRRLAVLVMTYAYVGKRVYSLNRAIRRSIRNLIFLRRYGN